MDADLSHDPKFLPSLIDAAGARRGLVIGSRYVPGGRVENWPLRRMMLSAFANTLHPDGDRPARARLHQRLSLLAARGAGADSARRDRARTATRFSSK